MTTPLRNFFPKPKPKPINFSLVAWSWRKNLFPMGANLRLSPKATPLRKNLSPKTTPLGEELVP